MFGVTRFNPWTEVAGLHRDIDSLFGRNFGRTEGTEASGVEKFTPATEVLKDGDKWMVSIYLPGVSQTDVDIEVVGQTLRVRGERKREKSINPYWTEITYG